MKIVVTQEHIDRGRKQDCHRCPIARAVAAALSTECLLVSVSAAGIDVDGWRYELPAAARYFMYDFDEGLHVEPFEFELETP